MSVATSAQNLPPDPSPDPSLFFLLRPAMAMGLVIPVSPRPPLSWQMTANVLAREALRRMTLILQAWDPKRSGTWPLRQLRDVQQHWVRSLMMKYGAFLSHDIDDVGTHRVLRPPATYQHVLDLMYQSVRVLFWEAVRRALVGANDPEDRQVKYKVRVVCELIDVGEDSPHVRYKIMSLAVWNLFTLDSEGLRTTPAELTEVSSVSWLATELYSVIEPIRHALETCTYICHWAACNEVNGYAPQGNEGGPGGAAATPASDVSETAETQPMET